MKYVLSKIFEAINIVDQRPGKKLKDNAKIVFVMDRSGSMDRKTKEFCAAMAEVHKEKLMGLYKRVTPVYMTYTTGLGNVMTHSTIEDMVTEMSTGGTITSSGLEVVKAEHRESAKTDLYVVLLSDGDNWIEDSDHLAQVIDELYEENGLRGMAYHEVTSRGSQSMGRMLVENPNVTAYIHRELRVPLK